MTARGSVGALSLAVLGLCSCPSCQGGRAPLMPQPVVFDGEGVPKWLAETAEHCTRIASCSKPSWLPQLRSASLCVDDSLPARSESAARLLCMRSARDCAAVEACLGISSSQRVVQYCKAHPEALSICQGDLWVTCAEKPEDHLYVDCTKLSGHCSEARLAGGLLVRGCSSPSLCPAGVQEARCDTPRSLVNCHDGMAERTECPSGTRCEVGPDGSSCVAAAGPKCGPVDDSYCMEDTLVECPSSERTRNVRTTDCGSCGLRCVARGKQASCRVGIANDCDGGTSQCVAGELSFCAAGRKLRVSCIKIGFAKCEPALHGLESACAGNLGMDKPLNRTMDGQL
jgi:hypothetical protein